MLNLGGIANLTLLPAADEVTGFDSGPANNLLDGWARQHLQRAYDQDGQWSAGGKVCIDLLDSMLHEPYFAARPPKSTLDLRPAVRMARVDASGRLSYRSASANVVVRRNVE